MSQAIPKWAQKALNPAQKLAIEEAITSVETKTNGEVVVMIAAKSSTVGHVPYTLFVSLLLLFALIDLPHVYANLKGEIWWPVLLWPLVAIVLTRFLCGIPFVQRLFVPADDRLAQVESRAEREFYRHHLQKTDGSTGVLLFISLLEHQAVVLGDQNIAKKLPPETWDKILLSLMLEAKKKRLGEGILAALSGIAPLLEQHFPAAHKNPNELPNHLIFVEA